MICMDGKREIYIVIVEDGTKQIIPITEEQLAQINSDIKPVIAKNIFTGKEIRFNSIKEGADFIRGIVGVSEETVYQAIKETIGKNYGRYGFKWRYEEILTVRENGKRVRCIETGEVFDSTRQAERETGADHSSISKCCSGKRKMCGGYTWEYVD